MLDKSPDSEEDDDEEDDDDTDQEAAPAMKKLRAVKAKLAQSEIERKALAAREESRTLIAEAGLPQEAALVEAVAAMPTAEKRKALLDTWKKGHASAATAVVGAKPRSASPSTAVPLQESAPADLPKADAKPFDKQSWLRS